MELVDRYLNAVRFWLPAADRQDIVRELSEDIWSQIDEREAEIGRTLEPAEIEALLDRRGHPIAVAARYLPQRALIGPVLLPVYLFVLKMVLWCYVVPWLAVWAGFVLFAPTYRAAHPGLALVGTLGPMWLIAVHAFAGLTGLFAYLEWSGAHSRYFARWHGRPAAGARDPDRISRGESAFALALGVLFVLWWLNVPQSPPPGVERTAPDLSAAWLVTYWAVLVLALGGVALTCTHLFRPWWTAVRAGVRLALDTAGLLLVGALLAVASRSGIAAAAETMGGPAAGEALWLKLSILVTLVVVAVIVLAAIVADARRFVRLSGARATGTSRD